MYAISLHFYTRPANNVRPSVLNFKKSQISFMTLEIKKSHDGIPNYSNSSIQERVNGRIEVLK